MSLSLDLANLFQNAQLLVGILWPIASIAVGLTLGISILSLIVRMLSRALVSKGGGARSSKIAKLDSFAKPYKPGKSGKPGNVNWDNYSKSGRRAINIYVSHKDEPGGGTKYLNKLSDKKRSQVYDYLNEREHGIAPRKNWRTGRKRKA